MSTLRSRLIRLAATYPPESDARQLLLATLKQARGEWKPLFENEKVRVQWQDHPENAVLVQELPFKPIKRKLRRRQYDTRYLVQWYHPGGAFLMQNILRDVHLSGMMDYDAVTRAMDAAVVKAGEKLLVESAEAHAKFPDHYTAYTEADLKRNRFPESVSGSDQEVFFLDVEPSNYAPVVFKGKDFGGTAEWTKFTFYDDSDEDEWMAQMEGMRAFYKSTASGGARNLFKLLKADPTLVDNMTVEKFKALLNKNRIGYEYIPTVWR